MSKSIKLKNGTYIDTSCIVFKNYDNSIKTLREILLHNIPMGANTDFNDLYNQGTYFCSSSMINPPSGYQGGHLIVLRDTGGSYILQIVFDRTNVGNIWTRLRVLNTWTDWKQLQVS